MYIPKLQAPLHTCGFCFKIFPTKINKSFSHNKSFPHKSFPTTALHYTSANTWGKNSLRNCFPVPVSFGHFCNNCTALKFDLVYFPKKCINEMIVQGVSTQTHHQANFSTKHGKICSVNLLVEIFLWLIKYWLRHILRNAIELDFLI